MEQYLSLSFNINYYSILKKNNPQNFDVELIAFLDRRIWYIEAKKRYEHYNVQVLYPITYLILAETHYLLSDYTTCIEYLKVLNELINKKDNSLIQLINDINTLITMELIEDNEYYQQGVQIFNGLHIWPNIEINIDKINNIKNKWTSLQERENNIISSFIRRSCISSNLLENVFSINGQSISNLIYKGFYENSIEGISINSRLNNKSTIIKILNNTVDVVQLMYIWLNNLDIFDNSFIKSLHKELMKNDNFIIEYADDYPVYRLIKIGQFRNVSCLTHHNENIIQFCHFSKIEKEMLNYCSLVKKLLNTNIDPFIKAAYIHAYFLIIHPFDANGIDGNGRLSRIISSLPLLQIGLPPIIIREHEKYKYFDCLHIFDTTGNLVPLANFLFNSLEYEIDNSVVNN